MIYNQSVFDPWPIESESVQAIITSPPYYALRKYDIPDVIIGGDKDCKHEFGSTKDKLLNLQAGNPEFKREWRKDATQNYNNGSFCIHCNAWKGQYGLEPTPQMYVDHTLLWAKEAWRVLRNDGIMFLNLADSYHNPTKWTNKDGAQTISKLWAKEAWRVLRNDGIMFLNLADSYHNPTKWTNKDGAQTISKGNARDLATGRKQDCGIPSKCQLLIPHRVAIALVDSGWTLRNTIIWYKTNAMPESVTDRFSKKYEYIFMFTKQEKYYFDLDAVREPHKTESIKRDKAGYKESPMQGRYQVEWEKRKGTNDQQFCNPLGKNPGDVWIITTQPSSEKHYAMWPERLADRMIKCSTKAGDTVLDCFAGSATTLKVAEQLHRKGIGIDLGYHEMSKRRTSKIQKELFV